MTFRIVVGGMPGTGKSTLVLSIHYYLTYHGIDCVPVELDVYSGTHPVIHGLVPPEERQHRSTARLATLNRVTERYTAAQNDIVLGDLPGRITSRKMPSWLQAADAAILIGREPVPKDLSSPKRREHVKSIEEWAEACEGHDTPVLARVQSWVQGQTVWPGHITARSIPNRRPAPQHPAVVHLANLVLAAAEMHSQGLPMGAATQAA